MRRDDGLTLCSHLWQVAASRAGGANGEGPPPQRAAALNSSQRSPELSENTLPAGEAGGGGGEPRRTVLCSTFIAKMPSSSDGTAAAPSLMSFGLARRHQNSLSSLYWPNSVVPLQPWLPARLGCRTSRWIEKVFVLFFFLFFCNQC